MEEQIIKKYEEALKQKEEGQNLTPDQENILTHNREEISKIFCNHFT